MYLKWSFFFEKTSYNFFGDEKKYVLFIIFHKSTVKSLSQNAREILEGVVVKSIKDFLKNWSLEIILLNS